MSPDFYSIFVDLYLKIKSGVKFEPDKRYDDIIQEGYQVGFLKINDDLIRLIIPDEDNQLNPDEMSCSYKHQYDV